MRGCLCFRPSKKNIKTMEEPNDFRGCLFFRPNSKNVFGVPLRVKRNTLPSAIEREERLFDSFQPLDESAREHGIQIWHKLDIKLCLSLWWLLYCGHINVLKNI